MEKQIEKLENRISDKEAIVNKGRLHRHRRKFYYAIGVLAALLVIWLLWHKQMTNMWHNLFDDPNTTSAVNKLSDLGAGGLSSAGTGGGSNQKSGLSDSTKSQENAKTTTTTTTTTTNTPSTPDSTPTDSSNLLRLATNATVGMNLGQLNSLAGVAPTSCTDISLTSLINQTVCTYTQNGQSVVVTLQNGTLVGTPIKLGF